MDLTYAAILGIVIGVPGFVGFVALITSHTRKMNEMKLRERELEMRAELGPVVDALADDLNSTRAEVAELQERLEFAERLLVAGNTPKDVTN
jgi:hypothetical protein